MKYNLIYPSYLGLDKRLIYSIKRSKVIFITILAIS